MSAMHNNLHETHNDRNVILQDGPKNKRKLIKKKKKRRECIVYKCDVMDILLN